MLERGRGINLHDRTITTTEFIIMGTLFYFIKETFRGFLQAKLMTFVSIVTIAITLFFLGCVGLCVLNIRLWLEEASKQASVVVYLEDAVYNDSSQCADIVHNITRLPSVDSVFLIDKNEAWDRFKKLYGARMLDAVDDNPLPASIEIMLSKEYVYGDATNAFKNELEQFSGIEGVQYSQEWRNVLRRFNRIFTWGAVIIIPFLLLALHFMIANTVKLTIYARKDLIINMHYVGATEFYIKTPFVLEGVLQGVIGGFFAITGLALLKLFLYHFLLDWGDNYLYLIIFSVGVIFGWIGSMSAVRRFLV